MTVMRLDPFQDLLSIQDQMNRAFDRVFGRPGEHGAPTPAWAPPLDVADHKHAYVVTVEVPGVSPYDIDVTLEGRMLTIQGERRQPQDSADRQYHRIERRYGSFRRSVLLPGKVQADGIEASAADGVLRVVVPKAEEAKPRTITVRAGGKPRAVTAR
jgi:HSP20 family protein